ncbi:hypothetical protein FACHB389_30275 [Nostoc calcicola FACHB-389]|nr:hypothetical protein FACHB389_30275 [Nostoc calcicola FACHB-389]
MKKNPEFRIQNSAILTLDSAALATQERLTRFPQRYQSGIGTGAGLVDHQIFNLVGVQKRRLFIRQSYRIHAEF